MNKRIIVGFIASVCAASCSNGDACKDYECKTKDRQTQATVKEQRISAKNSNQEINCKLTTTDLQKRKETVIASLKSQVLEKKELPNGFAFKFKGSDRIVDELAEFVKSERSCCSFFVFDLSFSGDGAEAWLNLTGPEGAKEMIEQELGL